MSLNSPIKRVTRKNKCQICGKPDWCGFTDDGKLAFCMRESAGSFKQAGNGAYIHNLSLDVPWTTRPTQTTTPIGRSGNVETIRAGIRRRAEVYSEMLTSLTLTESHANLLLHERRLSDTSIANNLYASVPNKSQANSLCNTLSSYFDLRGVPGFYCDNSQWRLNINGSGFFVPYRNADGLISALQIRRDDNSPRYMWLSSSNKTFGTSSGAPLHFVKPHVARSSNEILITEGALKADCISEQTDLAAIAVAGVSVVAPDKLISQLRQNLPELKTITLAFDIDWRNNKVVKDALIRLGTGLRDSGFDVNVCEWDTLLGKGLDDVLIKEK